MKKKEIIRILILAALFIFLVNPSLIPFIDDGARQAIAAELEKNFSVIAGGTPMGIFAPGKLISALAAAVFTYLATTIVCLVMDKLTAGKRRSQTVAGLVSSIVKTVGTLLGLVWVLSIMGVDLGAIFVSLGVVSLIVGFGVQSLIEDCVTGIFLILENQYNIGDVVIVGDFRGTVKRISMRTTTLQDDGGNIKIVNNSDIRNVQNRSNQCSVATCEIGISYDADLEKVEKIIQDALPAIYEANKDVFAAVPKYAGVQLLDASAVVLRINAEVEESKIFAAKRRLNREFFLLFRRNDIEIPFNQLVIHEA